MSTAEPLLEAEGIVKEFGLRRSRVEMLRGTLPGHRAVDDVSFTLARGEILGIAGGSGSGKTTLARCLIRLVEPDAGSIRLEGEDVRAANGT
jgi:ABC-type oligopeptide transport system ATPase subunit